MPTDLIKIRMQADVTGTRYRGLMHAFSEVIYSGYQFLWENQNQTKNKLKKQGKNGFFVPSSPPKKYWKKLNNIINTTPSESIFSIGHQEHEAAHFPLPSFRTSKKKF